MEEAKTKDAFTRLAILAKHADPRARNVRKVKEHLEAGKGPRIIVRCRCGQKKREPGMLECGSCHCLSHSECYTEHDAEDFVCDQCKTHACQYMTGKGCSADKLVHRTAALVGKKTREDLRKSLEAKDAASIGLEQAIEWLSVLNQYDSIDNLYLVAAQKATNSPQAIMDEFYKEKEDIAQLVRELSDLMGDLDSISTPLTDSLVEQISSVSRN